MNHILRNVLMSRSTLQFDPKPIRDEELMEILEEGKLLSNAVHNRGWHFTVLQNRALIQKFQKLHEKVIVERRADAFGGPAAVAPLLPDVPVLLIISGRRGEKFLEDAARMVFASMMLGSAKAGIGACWISTAIAIFDSEEGKAFLSQLGIPADYTPFCAGAFGYRRAPAAPPHPAPSEDNIINIIR